MFVVEAFAHDGLFFPLFGFVLSPLYLLISALVARKSFLGTSKCLRFMFVFIH